MMSNIVLFFKNCKKFHTFRVTRSFFQDRRGVGWGGIKVRRNTMFISSDAISKHSGNWSFPNCLQCLWQGFWIYLVEKVLNKTLREIWLFDITKNCWQLSLLFFKINFFTLKKERVCMAREGQRERDRDAELSQCGAQSHEHSLSRNRESDT